MMATLQPPPATFRVTARTARRKIEHGEEVARCDVPRRACGRGPTAADVECFARSEPGVRGGLPRFAVP